MQKLLKVLEANSEYDVYYADESGFSLAPSVAYAWQMKKERINVNSQRSPRINVFGIMNHENKLELNMFESNINSEVVLACIEGFSKKIKKKTVLVLDNASIHKSKKFKESQRIWRKRGLRILFLPTYSPELNSIERLWQFVKYKWLSFSAYESFASLKTAIFDIFANFGSKYNISFA